jgi:hypothetical protein
MTIYPNLIGELLLYAEAWALTHSSGDSSNSCCCCRPASVACHGQVLEQLQQMTAENLVVSQFGYSAHATLPARLLTWQPTLAHDVHINGNMTLVHEAVWLCYTLGILTIIQRIAPIPCKA